MPTPTTLYPFVLAWLQAMGVAPHRTAQRALAAIVVALLLAQSLRPRFLMRALPSAGPVPARQRYQRVARVWPRPWLSSVELPPHLVSATVALMATAPEDSPVAGLTHVALDSVRCGAWEIFPLGVVWQGRVRLVGWTVLPYPLPKKRFTPAVCALIRQVAAAWPGARPVHLLADRAFPSRRLFQTLRAVGWGWTIRLRARNWVTVDGTPQWVRDQLAAANPLGWTATVATFGSGPQAIPGTLVLGRGLPVLPWHQRGLGSRQQRAAQQARRRQHLGSKHRGRIDASVETDGWVVLFTSHAPWRLAVTSYGLRWATEGTYRDAQGGWDGQHGWDLEATVRRLTRVEQVERVVGLWALGTLLQSWLGTQLTAVPAVVGATVGEGTTTGRLSIWARGHFALTEPSGRLAQWIGEALSAGAAQIAAARRAPASTDPTNGLPQAA